MRVKGRKPFRAVSPGLRRGLKINKRTNRARNWRRAREVAVLRAAKEREARLEQALARRPKIEAIKKRQGKKPEEARGSMTDAEATVMKMGDGGFHPAYNPQIASDADSLVIAGRDVATIGSDQGQMAPMMVEPVIERCGQAPEFWRVESDYIGHEQIEQAS